MKIRLQITNFLLHGKVLLYTFVSSRYLFHAFIKASFVTSPFFYSVYIPAHYIIQFMRTIYI